MFLPQIIKESVLFSRNGKSSNALLAFSLCIWGVATLSNAQTVVYQDSFDNDTLAVNTGTGGGLVNRSFGGHNWTDNGDLNFNRSGTNFRLSALAYSSNTFQSDEGFELTVDYSDGSFTTPSNKLSFGLISDSTNLATYGPSNTNNRNPFSDPNLFSFGLTGREGLRFTDGTSVSLLDGTNNQAGSTAFFSLLNDGAGGADWSYSIDGVSINAGNLAVFDFSASYHFAAYGQDDQNARSLQSVMLVIIDPVTPISPAKPAPLEISPVVTVVDIGAISQLVGSAIPMNLAVGQAASNIHNVSARSLNQRINRLRMRQANETNQAYLLPDPQSPSAVRVSYLMGAAGFDVPLVIDSGKASISDDSVTYGNSAKDVLDPDVVASGENWSIYASADYGLYDIDPLKGSSGLESDTYASTAGIEYVINDHWAVGAGLSHVWSNNSLHNGLGGFDIEGNAAMTYVSYFKNNFWGDLLYSYGNYGVDIHRNTLLGSTVRAEPDLESHQATLNLGYNLTTKNRFVHGPTFRADQGWGSLEGYTERGDARANTTFREQDYESLVTTLGWQINWETDTPRGVKLRPNFRLGYGRENLDQETKVSGTLEQSPFYKVNADTGAVLGSGPTVTNSLRRIEPGDGWMEVGAGLGVEFTNRFGVYADYQGRVFQDAARLHLGTLKASWKW